MNVDQRRAEVIVQSYSKAVAGFWVMNGTFFRLPVGTDDAELGASVQAALAASQRGVPTPPREANPVAPLLRELGLKSYGQYEKGIMSVGVRVTDDAVTVVPKHNGGSRTGFTEIPELSEVLRGPSASELGAAVRRGLANAT